MGKAKAEEKKSLEEVMKELIRTYGKGSVIHGNDIDRYEEVVSTGSLSLDIATGIGGIPIGNAGKIIELYGWESSGKSTLSQTIIGNYQKLNKKKVLLVDGENSLSEDYATNLGIDLNDLLLIQLDEGAGEAAYNKAEKLIETGEIGLCVYDSYNSLQPKKLIDGEIGESTMGLHARMQGQAVMKANSLCGKYGCTFLFIGQLREKIGVLYGSPETTQGGNALRFYAHMRMEISRSTTKDNSVMEGDIKHGNLTKVHIVKNKLSKPFRKASFNILYAVGIDKYTELIEVGHDYEVLKKYGESVTYNGEKHRVEDFISLIEDNEDLYEEIRNKILYKTGILKENAQELNEISTENVQGTLDLPAMD